MPTAGQQAAPLYNHFTQAKAVIDGIEAIDYFFAKEILSALVNKNAAVTASSENTESVAPHYL